MIVYLARDIPAFVMYCVNGASRSSLLIESTDSVIDILVYALKEVCCHIRAQFRASDGCYFM